MHQMRRSRTGSTELPPRRRLEDPRDEWKSPRKKETRRRYRHEQYLHRRAKEAVEREENTTLTIQTARVFVPLLRAVRYKGAKGGRGSGKSHCFAEMLVERAIENPDLRAVCIREVQLSLSQSVKRLIEDKIKSLNVGHFFEVLVTHINIRDRWGRTRGRVIFQGMQNHTADSIKSLEGYDIAWVEEAQSLSQRSLDLLRPTIRKDGSELWFSWNPTSPKDPVDKFFNELKAANDNTMTFALVQANWSDNPWFPKELEAERLHDKRRDPDRYRHVWGGEYQKLSQARVFRNWRIGTRAEFADKNIRKLIPRYGGDFGFAVDPTVAIKCRIDEANKRLYIEAEAYKVGCEIDETADLFDKLDNGEARKWPMIADSSRPETISYLKRNGYARIKAAKKGPGSVKEGVEFIKSYDVIVHPDCKHTEEELINYSYEVDEKTQEVLPILEDSHNHVIDAIRYAVENIRHATRAGVLF